MMDVTDLRHDGGWSDRDGVIYKPASLTDAEREAVAAAAANYQRLCDEYGPSEEDEEILAALRGLLERMK